MLRKLSIGFRFVRSWICFVIFGVGALLISIIFFPPGFLFIRNKAKRLRYFIRVIRYSWFVFLWFFKIFRLGEMRLHPSEAFRKLRGSVVVSNHPSLIDVVFLIVAIPDVICVVKSALKRNFVITTLVRNACLPNDIPFPELEEKAKDLLAEGFNVLIFPEATRSRLDVPSSVRLGAFRIAVKASAPLAMIKIVPEDRVLAKEQPLGYAGSRYTAYDMFLQEPPQLPDVSPRKRMRLLAEAFRENCL